MKKKPCFLADKIHVSEIALNTFDPENLEMLPLLLQTGYLTIADVNDNFGEFNYTLDFPNNEVRIGFSKWLMNAYVSDNINQNETIQAAMVRAINLGEAENFVENLKKLFASIPYNLQDKFKIEQAYQVVVYIVCVYCGVQAHAEHITNKGRIDIFIEAPDFAYIIEMKLDKPAQEAIDQIHEKGYHEQFKNLGKKLFLMGLSFSSEEKNITEHIIEEL